MHIAKLTRADYKAPSGDNRGRIIPVSDDIINPNLVIIMLGDVTVSNGVVFQQTQCWLNSANIFSKYQTDFQTNFSHGMHVYMDYDFGSSTIPDSHFPSI